MASVAARNSDSDGCYLLVANPHTSTALLTALCRQMNCVMYDCIIICGYCSMLMDALCGSRLRSTT